MRCLPAARLETFDVWPFWPPTCGPHRDAFTRPRTHHRLSAPYPELRLSLWVRAWPAACRCRRLPGLLPTRSSWPWQHPLARPRGLPRRGEGTPSPMLQVIAAVEGYRSSPAGARARIRHYYFPSVAAWPLSYTLRTRSRNEAATAVSVAFRADVRKRQRGTDGFLPQGEAVGVLPSAQRRKRVKLEAHPCWASEVAMHKPQQTRTRDTTPTAARLE